VVDRVIEEYLKEHGSGSMRLDERPGFGLVSYRFQAIIAGKDLLADGKSAILYLHGGAFIVCSPITHSALCLYLSAEAGGIPIYSLDYPLSPEFHFPAALNCAAEAYRDLMNRGFTNIAIAGDSAGGNLVLALLLKLQELNLPAPKCAVAMSPWADLTHSGESIQTNAAIDPLLPKELLNTAAEFYVQDEKELLDPLVSPLFASKEQFEKFPPLALHVGAKEVLYDDSIRIAEKIGLDRTQLVVWEGMHHVFPLSVGTLEESDRAVHDIANFIIQHIHHHQNDENEEKEKENSSHTKE
jgi:acetyl esterase/lipase